MVPSRLAWRVSMQTATNYPINEYPNERDRQFTREQEGVHERVWREEKGRGNEVIIISTIKKIEYKWVLFQMTHIKILYSDC